MAGIQVAMHAIALQGLGDVGSSARMLLMQTRAQVVEDFGRQGISQPEGDRLGETGEIGMWKVATGTPATADRHRGRLYLPTANRSLISGAPTSVGTAGGLQSAEFETRTTAD